MNRIRAGLRGNSLTLTCIAMLVSGVADANAADEIATVVATATAAQAPLRSPSLTVGGVRNGSVMVISEGGTANVTLAQFKQLQVQKPSPFSDFCRVQ